MLKFIPAPPRCDRFRRFRAVVYGTSFEQQRLSPGAHGQGGWLADAGSVTNNPARAHTGPVCLDDRRADRRDGKWAWENTSR